MNNLFRKKKPNQSSNPPKPAVSMEELQLAIRSNNIEKIKTWIEEEGDVNTCFRGSDEWVNGHTPLTLACNQGKLEIVKILCDVDHINVNFIVSLEFSDGDVGKSSALIRAAFHNYANVVKVLLGQRNVNVNITSEENDTALIHAAINGHLDIVKLLLQHNNINVNHANNTSDTALIFVADNGHLDIVKLLLQHNNINVNHASNIGDTALIFSAFSGHLDIVKLLLQHNNINVNHAEDNYGDTALILATVNGHLDIVKLLLQHNDINVNHANNQGNTALGIAALASHVEVVNCPFTKAKNHKGVDLNIVNKQGNTALDRCERDSECFKLIEHALRASAAQKAQEAVEQKQMEKQRLACEVRAIELSGVRREIEEKSDQLQKLDNELVSLRADVDRITSQCDEIVAQKTPLQAEIDDLRQKEQRLNEQSTEQGAAAASSGTANPLAQEVECPVCLEVMKAPRMIYQCAEGHTLCSVCLANITHCPLCREQLPQPPVRCRVLEKFINNS